MPTLPSPTRPCADGRHRGPWTAQPHMTAWLRDLARAAHMDLVVPEQGRCAGCGSDTAIPVGAVIVVDVPAAAAA